MLWMVDHRQYILLVLLDLRAYFDAIDHDAMIQRLKNPFCINGDTLVEMQSYAGGRMQRVVIGNSGFTPFTLSIGIPQGSVAGPWTFLVYI